VHISLAHDAGPNPKTRSSCWQRQAFAMRVAHATAASREEGGRPGFIDSATEDVNAGRFSLVDHCTGVAAHRLPVMVVRMAWDGFDDARFGI
jgi:hypothetical protein